MLRNRKSALRRRMGLEMLEDRLTPAGLVTAQLLLDGTLLICGDALNNKIEVTEKYGDIEVKGNATAVNGVAKAEFDADAVARVVIKLDGGNDTAYLSNLKVLGGIEINDDLGNDTYSAWNLDMSTASLSVNTGAGKDCVTVDHSLLGGLFVSTGAGNDEVGVDDSIVNITLIETNGGDDELKLEDSALTSLSANTGAGNDEIKMKDLISSILSVDAGAGSDFVYVDDVVALTTGLVNGGSGSDVLQQRGSNFFVHLNFEGFL